MKIMKSTGYLLVILGFAALAATAGAEEKGSKSHIPTVKMDEEFRSAANEALDEKTKYSGTLDIWDETADVVRNLRLMKFKEDYVKSEASAFVTGKFRDTATGDTVTVLIELVKEDGDWSVGGTEIREVEKLKIEEKEFSDDDVFRAMKDHVETRSAAVGSYMLYDPEAEEMLNLQLVDIDDELRQYGDLSIATATFEDLNTGKTVKVDITVKDHGGYLKVETMKIKK